MNNFEDLYDFPMSQGCHRAMCQLHGLPVPPAIVVYPDAMTEAEDKAQFIKWQDEQCRLFYFREKKNMLISKTNVLTHQPMYKKQDIRIGGGRGLREGMGGDIESGKPKSKGRLVANE